MADTIDAGVPSGPEDGLPRSLLDEVYLALGLPLPIEPVHPVVRCVTIATQITILLLIQLWIGMMFVVSKLGFGAEAPDIPEGTNVEMPATTSHAFEPGPSEVSAECEIADGLARSKRDVTVLGDGKTNNPFSESGNPKDGLMKLILDEAPFGVASSDKEHGMSSDPAVQETQSTPSVQRIPREHPIRPTQDLEEVQAMVGDIIRAEEEMAAQPKGEQNELGNNDNKVNNKKPSEELRRPVVTESLDVQDFLS